MTKRKRKTKHSKKIRWKNIFLILLWVLAFAALITAGVGIAYVIINALILTAITMITKGWDKIRGKQYHATHATHSNTTNTDSNIESLKSESSLFGKISSLFGVNLKN